MQNPWLNVPLADYEGHMASPGVLQLAALSDLFAEALALCRPRSVAVLGVAGGNGLERIDASVTTRVVGVDINPKYISAARARFGNAIELHCLDLAEESASIEPVDLVHAALIFEHAGAGRCLENAMAMAAPGGAIAVVLQLASESTAAVSPSRFPSLQSLAPHFELIDPEWLRTRIENDGFTLLSQTRRSLPGGKAFWMGIFRRGAS